MVRPDFIPTEYKNIQSLVNRPDLVVRVGPYLGQKREGKYTGQRYIEMYKKGKELLDEFREKYGFAVPSVNNLIGEAEQGYSDYLPRIFTVTDRVYGNNLEELLPAFTTEKLKEELEALYLKLINYFQDKVGKHDVLEDIDNAQFMYGKKKGDTDDRIYFVDIEPIYTPKELGKEPFSMVIMLGKMIAKGEELTKHRLVKTRERFLEFYNANIPDEQKKVFQWPAYVNGLLETNN